MSMYVSSGMVSHRMLTYVAWDAYFLGLWDNPNSWCDEILLYVDNREALLNHKTRRAHKSLLSKTIFFNNIETTNLMALKAW